MPDPRSIVIKGAREHNLKNLDLTLPRDKLIVITGLSGSGKSSLAFDTIYAEGQRRYVESLSAYARQFLEQMDKPDVDSIEGLSPAIAIEQKTTSRNPRSTVGTVTEIYDYLRLLFARIGRPHCPQCGDPITAQTVQQMVDALMAQPAGAKLSVLAPIVRDRKGEYRKELQDSRRAGFIRARIDGKPHDLAEEIALDKQKKHTIEIVVDRVVLKHDDPTMQRLADSLEIALKQAHGLVVVSVEGGKDLIYSEKLACVRCGFSYSELTPRLFSFNSPHGACPACDGLGHEPPKGCPVFGEDDEYEEEAFETLTLCPICKGDRLKPESLTVLLDRKSIAAVTRLSIQDAGEFFQRLKLTEREQFIAHRILKEIRERLGFLINVGLDYLTRKPRRSRIDRKSTRLNSSHGYISYAVFCLKKKNKSTNFGKTWNLVSGRLAAAKDHSNGAIAIYPNNPQHIFIGTKVTRPGDLAINAGRYFAPDCRSLSLSCDVSCCCHTRSTRRAAFACVLLDG